MGTKREELENPDGCLGKAADEEPIFILRGKDMIAPFLVRQWARHYAMLNSDAVNVGTELKPDIRMQVRQACVAKHNEALALADRMDKWIPRKVPD